MKFPMRLTYANALVLSIECWQHLYETGGYSKRTFILKNQPEASFRYLVGGAYTSPFLDCWLCEYFKNEKLKSKDIKNLCFSCPLGSCSGRTPYAEWCKSGQPKYNRQIWAKYIRDKLIRGLGDYIIWPEK